MAEAAHELVGIIEFGVGIVDTHAVLSFPLDEATEARLQREADEQGLTLEEYAEELLADL